MADSFISPAVGGTMWAFSALLVALSIKKLKNQNTLKSIPLMGVMGAFIFACQMLNFSIPGTGSSGHLGGGMILAILLGPYAGFLTLSSVLIIQALFFADGGLLALGCNMFNLGFYTCFIAYPLLFRPFINQESSKTKIAIFSIIACIVGLQLGAFSVVVETTASGITALPFDNFLWLMQPIHLAIGVVEGLATAAVVLFVRQMEPNLVLNFSDKQEKKQARALTFAALAALTLLFGTVVSLFASEHPDGLEWSIEKSSIAESQPETQLEQSSDIHEKLAMIQSKTEIMPDYALPVADEDAEPNRYETSLAGVGGSLMVGAFIVAVCLPLKSRKKKQQPSE